MVSTSELISKLPRQGGRGQRGGGLWKQRFSKWVNRKAPGRQNRTARP